MEADVAVELVLNINCTGKGRVSMIAGDDESSTIANFQVHEKLSDVTQGMQSEYSAITCMI